jgi:hypothetical protein
VTPKNNIFGSKPVTRDVEEVTGENSYILLGYHYLRQFVCQENLLLPLFILVVVLASRRKIDGTDFGCVSIQSYGIVVPI